ncbi:MAG: bifunctional UDP-N-acetylglucosamine diphosphorylase/glucosamine-1-phosphate N-acetyltransferase GlmU [Chloroflexi bacterium]|nr:MAG: bifunctional UDP-N-acetylglucosamine diphosphorylase/glucosamine-1-phosphate N-acetyltransferase GlmU [Chloroflexota bacterium]
MRKLAVVLLAAGQGTRMKSKTQKILHEVGGKPMVMHIFDAAESVADVPPVLVVGKGADGVQNLIGSRAQYAIQAEQMGTGHATMMAEPLIKGLAAQVIVTYGDMPLLCADTLARLAQTQSKTNAAVVMLSVMGDLTSTFGRVVRDQHGYVAEIVEVAEARLRPNTQELLAIPELNVGVYCFDGQWLWENIHDLPLRQARSGQEYYLTDMIALAVKQNRLVEAIVTEDVDESMGAGTRAELVAVERAFRARANKRWLDNGVTLIEPATIFIDQEVEIGQDTIVWPNTYLQGSTTIGADCVIGPNAIIRDAKVGNHCRLEQTVVENCVVVDGTIGKPFRHVVGGKE